MICRPSPSGDRVELESHCVFYLEGEAEIDFQALIQLNEGQR